LVKIVAFNNKIMKKMPGMFDRPRRLTQDAKREIDVYRRLRKVNRQGI